MIKENVNVLIRDLLSLIRECKTTIGLLNAYRVTSTEVIEDLTLAQKQAVMSKVSTHADAISTAFQRAGITFTATEELEPEEVVEEI